MSFFSSKNGHENDQRNMAKYDQGWHGRTYFFRVHPKYGPKLQFLEKIVNFRMEMTKNGQIVTVKNDHDLIEMILSRK